eukprot:scaffold669_cov379-Prasinococcus_capsulatus_cf.AAC.1
MALASLGVRAACSEEKPLICDSPRGGASLGVLKEPKGSAPAWGARGCICAASRSRPSAQREEGRACPLDGGGDRPIAISLAKPCSRHRHQGGAPARGAAPPGGPVSPVYARICARFCAEFG